jgi:hypothetical protein
MSKHVDDTMDDGDARKGAHLAEPIASFQCLSLVNSPCFPNHPTFIFNLPSSYLYNKNCQTHFQVSKCIKTKNM